MSSLLAADLDFLRQPLERHLGRLRFLGVRYLVILSPWVKNGLARQGLSRTDFDGWSIFELEGAAPPWRVPGFRPALVAGEVSFKSRTDADCYFVRLAEEQFCDGHFRIPLATGLERRLDRLEDLEEFGSLLALSYDYTDEDLAFERLRSFAQSGALILFASESPLLRRIRAAARQFRNAHFLDGPPDAGGVRLDGLRPDRSFEGSPCRRL